MFGALRTFCLVARMGSFTRAAEAAGLTRPAVSQQIKQLEGRFGVPLFVRSTRQVDLTAAGQELLAQAERVLAAGRDMEAAMEAIRRGERQTVAVAASTLPGESLLPRALAVLRRERPGIEAHVRMGNTEAVLSLLRQGQVDIGLVGEGVADPQLACEVVAEDEIVLALPPGSTFGDPLTLAELRQLPLILRERGSATRHTVLAALASRGVELGDLQVVAELGSPESIKAAVRSGVGGAFLSRMAVAEGEMEVVRLAGLDLRRPVCACWRRDRPLTPALRALVAGLHPLE